MRRHLLETRERRRLAAVAWVVSRAHLRGARGDLAQPGSLSFAP